MLAQAEISQLDVPLSVKKDVVRFQVPVDVVVFVNGLNRADSLSNVESRLFLCQDVLAHQQGHQVAPRHEVHH